MFDSREKHPSSSCPLKRGQLETWLTVHEALKIAEEGEVVLLLVPSMHTICFPDLLCSTADASSRAPARLFSVAARGIPSAPRHHGSGRPAGTLQQANTQS